MNVTEKELQVIAQIAINEFNSFNGAVPDSCCECYTWIDCVDCTPVANPIVGKALSGVLGSLYEKNLANSNGESIGLTEAGFTAFKNSKYPTLHAR